jgi:hypothetical protein
VEHRLLLLGEAFELDDLLDDLIDAADPPMARMAWRVGQSSST